MQMQLHGTTFWRLDYNTVDEDAVSWLTNYGS